MKSLVKINSRQISFLDKKVKLLNNLIEKNNNSLQEEELNLNNLYLNKIIDEFPEYIYKIINRSYPFTKKDLLIFNEKIDWNLISSNKSIDWDNDLIWLCYSKML